MKKFKDQMKECKANGTLFEAKIPTSGKIALACAKYKCHCNSKVCTKSIVRRTPIMKVEAIRNPYDHRVVELWACRANERSFIAILSVDSFVYESFYQDLSDGIDVELEVTRLIGGEKDDSL